VQPFGAEGGHDGPGHRYSVLSPDGDECPLGVHDSAVRIVPGSRIVCRSAGGGGYGDPRARPEHLVRRDVSFGYVSDRAACTVYGMDG
jgi:N-methylhydantoinase B